MPHQTAELELSSGHVISLFVQDSDLGDSASLTLADKMSRTQWSDASVSMDRVTAFTRRMRLPETVSCELRVHDGVHAVNYGAVELHRTNFGAEDQVVLTNAVAGGAANSPLLVHITVDPDATGAAGTISEVSVVLYPKAARTTARQSIAAAALRVRHLMHAAVGLRTARPATIAACLSTDDMPSALIECDTTGQDCSYLRALRVAYAIETDGGDFLDTDIGQRLLTASVAPSAALRAEPEKWAHLVATHARMQLRAPVDHRAIADSLDVKLTEAWLTDKLRDLWTGTTEGIEASLRRVLPSAETLQTLKSLAGRATTGAKAVAGSKTAEQVMLAAMGNKGDATYAEIFAKALLGDAGLDETASGQVIIENADKVSSALASAFNKLRQVKASDLDRYTKGLRNMFNNEDLRGGLAAVLKQARRAPELWAKYGDDVMAAGKKAVQLGGSALQTATKLVV